MCLYSKREKPMVAKMDITCYKMLIRSVDGKLRTPYYAARASLGEAIVAKYNEEYPLNSMTTNYMVTSEGVHAYAKMRVVDRAARAFNFIDTTDIMVVIAEATIPAGTEYWRSEDGKEIAARRMIINRIIN